MTWLQGDMMVTVESCQELPKLPNVVNSCPGLLKVAKYCHKLPKQNTKNCKKIKLFVRDCQKLTKVAESWKKKLAMDCQKLTGMAKCYQKLTKGC